MPSDEISFVIRTRDEERWIGHALQSIFDSFGSKTPIVIVDNMSKDDTLKIISLFEHRTYDITILPLSMFDYTPGVALNKGIMHVHQNMSSKVVGILSAHCVITHADCAGVMRHFDDDDVFAVMGQQVPIYRGKRIKPRYIWKNFFDVGNGIVVNPIEDNGLEKRSFFHNAFSFVRVDDWCKRQFPNDLVGKEDRYWANDFVADGRKFMLDTNLKCNHHWTSRGATWHGIG